MESARKSDKRLRIMQAAERLFTSRRFHEITMDDVAASAGVAKGTLYGHFKDKDELFFQTCTSGFEELCELLAQKVPAGGPFEQQLLDACRHISVFFDRRRQLMGMMQAEEGRMAFCTGGVQARWMEKRKRLVAAVATILDHGVRSGLVRKDVSTDVLANILMGMLRARARGFADAPPAMRRYEVIVDLFCNGAAARRPAVKSLKLATANGHRRSLA